MFAVRLMLSSMLLAALTLCLVRGEAGDIASDAVQAAINQAKFQAGPPLPDMDAGMDAGGMMGGPPAPPKREKKKREVKKKSNKKKSSKDWSKIDVNEMSEDWEDGDDEDELEHEYERIQRIAAAKAAKASKVLKSGNNKKIKKYVHMAVGLSVFVGGGGWMGSSLLICLCSAVWQGDGIWRA
jgi:hypothetical protein